MRKYLPYNHRVRESGLATNQKVACSSHAGRTIESKTCRKPSTEIAYHGCKCGWAVGRPLSASFLGADTIGFEGKSSRPELPFAQPVLDARLEAPSLSLLVTSSQNFPKIIPPATM